MIAVHDLTLTIDGHRILDGVSLDVARGESVALVGPNGSGKTSLLRCLLGLVPFTGYASIGGHDVVRQGVAARRITAWLPQRPAFGDLTAREVLRFTARLRGCDRRRIEAVLARVGLEAAARQRARTFSGGMQQRLALALALLADAPVLLFDEPTANLDREAQEVFQELVGQMRAEGRTLLLASHRVEEIGRLTGRAAVLDRGRIVEDLPPAGRVAAPVVALDVHKKQARRERG